MQDFLAVAACAAVFVASFLVLKKAKCKKSVAIYSHGGNLTIESGKIYDVSFGLSEYRTCMLVTDMHFAADCRGLDAVVRLDSRPRRLISFVEGE